MSEYRDAAAGLRDQIRETRDALALRMQVLRGLRSAAVPVDLRTPPELPSLDAAAPDRLKALLARLQARAQDVEIAIAATDAAFAQLAFPGVTMQEEVLGARGVPRERVTAEVGDDALVEVLAQSTLARFRRDGVGLLLAVGDARGTVAGRLAVAVPRALGPIVGWPDGAIPVPNGVARPSGEFWLSYGRAVIAWTAGEILPADAVTYLLALRAAIAEAW